MSERRCQAALAYTAPAEGISARGGAWGGWNFPAKSNGEGANESGPVLKGAKAGAEEFPASVTRETLGFFQKGKYFGLRSGTAGGSGSPSTP